jgi:DNA polymerase-3 subunit epsilon
MELNLEKPLAFFDLETTGTQVATDRIVQVAVVKIQPDGGKDTIDQIINPEMDIPEEVTQIHGISDLDVVGKPTFAEFAPKLYAFLDNCDLAGYNAIKFDIPLLVEEFLRVGIDFDLKDRKFIDVQNIFHKMEPRTLKAAYKFYCNKPLERAHDALADTEATYEILKAQLDVYEDAEFTDKNGKVSKPVVNDVAGLHNFSTVMKNVDLVGHIVFNDRQQEVFNFGKYKGRAVETVFRKEPAYYDWMMRSQFPQSTKKVIQAIKMRIS